MSDYLDLLGECMSTGNSKIESFYLLPSLMYFETEFAQIYNSPKKFMKILENYKRKIAKFTKFNKLFM